MNRYSPGRGNGGAFQTINQVGQSLTMVQAVGATICCILGVGIALYLIFSRTTMISTKATVVSSDCRTIATKDGNRMACTSQVKYTINGKEYTSTLIENSLNASRYATQVIDILVDSNAPQSVSPHRPSNKTLGFVLSVVCLCIFVCAWAQFFFAKKVPGAGAGLLAMAAFD